ncbi:MULTISPECIES: DUF1513 domain-containing protein [Halomonas]|uniref:DUF1513 domain-containing protein n=1 Tax=Halomonas TaxID=2745 RepID=UPI001A8CAC04|nr:MULTISPECIES: DUF1513 domain-containing protein [Halomonas]MBN8411054.1 DUF1513 domain-containing protein [Halomonas litopenaei]MBY5986211.1 DUF1513 domain-containing protein [Halomonas sp. DP5Y7-2]
MSSRLAIGRRPPSTSRQASVQDPLRRRLLVSSSAGLALTGLALSGLPTSLWASDEQQRREWFFSAVDDSHGGHHLAGVRRDGSEHFLLPAPERCHGGCLRPGHDQAVLFARRPGYRFHVIDASHQATLMTIEAGDGRHFYGHGVFDPSGRWLYLTANRVEDAMGLVQVRDAEDHYRLVNEWELDGIGPHEIGLMPDGASLAIALGGILTRPESGRAKLNLAEMAPALLLIDRQSGDIVERHRPSHHQLSCRHLDIADDGSIIVGYQFQGPEWETHHPLIARRSADGGFEEWTLPDQIQAGLAQYTASVAVSQVAATAAVSAPRGNRVLLIDRNSGALQADLPIDDAAGLRCDGSGGYLITTGSGDVHHLASSGHHSLVASLPLRWDNHLT